MIRGEQKFIDRSSNPLITAIGIKFLETSNENVQVVAKANNRTYKSLPAATNEGMSFKKLQPAIENAVWDTLYSVAGMKVEGLREKALKSAIVAYVNTPPTEVEIEYSRVA
jgi:formylmethanofuran:tetrahydromethanopterin formyltransferase